MNFCLFITQPKKTGVNFTRINWLNVILEISLDLGRYELLLVPKHVTCKTGKSIANELQSAEVEHAIVHRHLKTPDKFKAVFEHRGQHVFKIANPQFADLFHAGTYRILHYLPLHLNGQ